jgi:hypothetical protein
MNCRRLRWSGITSERNRWSITWDLRATTFSVEIQSMSEMISSSLKMTCVINNFSYHSFSLNKTDDHFNKVTHTKLFNVVKIFVIDVLFKGK